jgi:putative MATE family efflux protein
VAFGLTIFALHTLIPAWFGLEGAAQTHASDYLGWVSASYLFKATELAYGNILNSRGRTRWNLVTAIVVNTLNVILNSWFVTGGLGVPALGVSGVALATCLSAFGGLVMSALIVHGPERVQLPRVGFSELRASMVPILKIALPSVLEPLSYCAMQMTLVGIIVTFGVEALAARTYLYNWLLLGIVWSVALGIATQILVARHVGAQRFDEADAQLRRSVVVGALGAFAFSATLFVFQGPALRVLTDSEPILALAAPLFAVSMLLEPLRPVNIIAGGALRSSGDARYTSLMGAALMWSVGLPAAYFFGVELGLGLFGIWCGMLLDEALRSVANFQRWRTGKWRAYGVARDESSDVVASVATELAS